MLNAQNFLTSIGPNANLYFNLFSFDLSAEIGVCVGLGIFFVALVGFFTRVDSLLLALIFAELMFVGVFVCMLTLSDGHGVVYPMYLLCTAATDSSIGLVLTLNMYRLGQTVSFNALTALRG